MKRSLTLGAITILLVGCTASWDRVVRYSPEPANASVVAEVYRAVLSDLTASSPRDSLALLAPEDLPPVDALVTGGGIRVPNHWADTLKREAQAALESSTTSVDMTALRQAARALGIVLLPSDTTDWSPWTTGHAPPARVRFSGPGFNADSTIAALRVDYWCGPLCGSGKTLLLARRPGKRWQVWHSFGHWIS
jgi:hypothetical protein